jgi:hypothetical protein
MEPISAFQALLLSAQLAGAAGKPALSAALPAPLVPAAAQPAPKPVLSIPLREIAAEQDRAVAYADVGRGRIGFNIALDPQAELWVEFRQGGRLAGYPLPALEKGVDARFPVEDYRFAVQDWVVRAYPLLQPQSPQASVPVPALLRSSYELALHVLFDPVEYAVLYEDGASGVPASLSLLREDRDGTLYVTFSKLSDLQTKLKWFLAVNGTMFGMKVEGDSLVFYSQPVPAVSEVPQGPAGRTPLRPVPDVKTLRAPEKALPR